MFKNSLLTYSFRSLRFTYNLPFFFREALATMEVEFIWLLDLGVLDPFENRPDPAIISVSSLV